MTNQGPIEQQRTDAHVHTIRNLEERCQKLHDAIDAAVRDLNEVDENFPVGGALSQRLSTKLSNALATLNRVL